MLRRVAIGALAVSIASVATVANYEGFSSKPYRDIGGVWTNGFGETEGVTANSPPISRKDAYLLLGKRLNEHALGIVACLKGVELYQNEFDAYASLAYNVGVFAVCDSSIKPKLQAKQYEAACKTILDFNKVKKKVYDKQTNKFIKKLVPIDGLTKRRTEEYMLCMTTPS